MGNREQFLMKMYDQMLNHIDRQIVVVWQSIATLLGAIAALGFFGTEGISFDVAASVVIAIVIWHLAICYDSSYWYNRNLLIIANIEKQFLVKDDLRRIHYYFGKHRCRSSMIMHLRIQQLLGFLIGLVVISFHLITRVWPELASYSFPQAEASLPYLILVIGLIILLAIRQHRIESYVELLKNSPGMGVDTSEIKYGKGHPPETDCGKQVG